MEKKKKYNPLDYVNREEELGPYKLVLKIREELIQLYKGKVLIQAWDTKMRHCNERFDRLYAQLKRRHLGIK
jgi:hypothetical protein